jgi:hypothetical protein
MARNHLFVQATRDFFFDFNKALSTIFMAPLLTQVPILTTFGAWSIAGHSFGFSRTGHSLLMATDRHSLRYRLFAFHCSWIKMATHQLCMATLGHYFPNCLIAWWAVHVAQRFTSVIRWALSLTSFLAQDCFMLSINNVAHLSTRMSTM